MTLEEVRLVVGGWVESQSQIALIAELWGISLAMRCRVQAITGELLVGLLTNDGGRIAIALSEPGIEFRYSQMRELPEFAEKWNLTTAQKFTSCLTVLFPPRGIAEDGENLPPESISFVEVIE